MAFIATAPLTAVAAYFTVSPSTSPAVALPLATPVDGFGVPTVSAEITGAFKPSPRCYSEAVRLLGLQPHEVMMVAAHKNDLLAAAKSGLRTAFVPRPLEAGPNRAVDLTPDPSFDVVATDFHDLATRLGCA